jgi:hypothetical protein
MKELVLPTAQAEAIVPQKSREQDVRPPINQSTPSTYENIQSNRQDPTVIPDSEDKSQGEQASDQDGEQTDSSSEQPKNESQSDAAETAIEGNAEQDSPEKNNSEQRAEQSEKQAEQEQAQLEALQIQELQQRDSEVKAHEQAHAAIGGTHAGTPNYEYETGPNGQKYAVGGEVSIDVSKETTPEETIRKMQTVHSAALAPAEPSSQDRKVAAQAVRNIADARAELVQANSSTTLDQADVNEYEVNKSTDSDDDIELPNQMSLAKNVEESINSSLFYNDKTAQVISNKYASTTVPHTPGFSAVA